MKTNCNIINDVLPIYLEGIASPETGAMVEEHLAGCSACRLEEQRLRGGARAKFNADSCRDEQQALKQIKSRLRKKRVATALCSVLALLVLLLGTGLWLLQSGRIGIPAGQIMEHEKGKELTLTASFGTYQDNLPVYAGMNMNADCSGGAFYLYIQKPGLDFGWHLVTTGVILPEDGIVQIDVAGYGRAYFSLNRDWAVSQIGLEGVWRQDWSKSSRPDPTIVQITDGSEENDIHFFDSQGNRIGPAVQYTIDSQGNILY